MATARFGAVIAHRVRPPISQSETQGWPEAVNAVGWPGIPCSGTWLPAKTNACILIACLKPRGGEIGTARWERNSGVSQRLVTLFDAAIDWVRAIHRPLRLHALKPNPPPQGLVMTVAGAGMW